MTKWSRTVTLSAIVAVAYGAVPARAEVESVTFASTSRRVGFL